MVDHNLKVRWHGHPMDPSFESTLQQAVNGTLRIALHKISESSESERLSTLELKSARRVDVKGKSREELMAMPVRDLKQVLADHGISSAGLPEKGDLVTVILDRCM